MIKETKYFTVVPPPISIQVVCIRLVCGLARPSAGAQVPNLNGQLFGWKLK
jgi:hypothetical protein